MQTNLIPYFLCNVGDSLFSPGKSEVFKELYKISVLLPMSSFKFCGSGIDLFKRTILSNLSIICPFLLPIIDSDGPTIAIDL